MPISHFFRRLASRTLLILLMACTARAQERSSADSTLMPSRQNQEQEVHLLYQSKPRKYVTGAVSSLSGAEVSNIPGSNRINSFTGRLSGLSVIQNDGLPGIESSTVLVRGFHSFAAGSAPMVLINGRVDDASMLEPNDIESITILKDAAATSLYGLNSANGIVLITTKRGKEGKIRINYNLESSFQQPTRQPEFLDAYNYAQLYNEAQLNDNPAVTPKYNNTALEAYRTGSNPFLYPNVNWSESVLKDYSIQTRNNLNVSGGSAVAKYYFSGSYLSDNGLFKVEKGLNKYNTNSNIDVINARANVDVNISKNLSLFADIRSKREKRNAPGAYNVNYDENIFGALYGTPANAYPMKNADGSLGGTTDYRNNPFGMLNYSGYSNYIITSLSTFSELAYDFGRLIKGLKLRGNFGFTNYTEFILNRNKNFEVYQLNTATTPASYTKIGLNSQMGSSGVYNSNNRIFDHSVALDYAAEFGKHHISSVLMYERQQFDNAQSTNLTRNFQGPKALLSYRFKNRYLLDFSAAYQGSEQYPKDRRYGFFPAIAAGWIVSDEDFMTGKGFDFLKVRGSFGRTGNPANGVYFDYLGSYAQLTGTGGAFGTNPSPSIGVYQNRIANPLITWEKTLKANAGLDIALLRNRMFASFDYFNEKTSDILIANAITAMYGAPIFSPSGSFKNKGFELQAGWSDRVRNFSYSISANYSSAKNKIIEMGEAGKDYPWMYQTGNSLSTRMGYVFDRYFTESDNLSALPDQSLLGVQRPGDLKYKDLNNDNIINDKDITAIGYGKIPEVNYGINLAGRYKGLDLSLFFHGTGKGSTYNSGPTYNEFTNSGKGNVLQHHLNRWTPGSGQSATYPRLTLSNTNNFVSSSYWLKDNSFLRLKHMEIGYSLPSRLTQKVKLAGTRVFMNGNNVFLWDKVDQKDPEAQDNGLSYPIQRSFSIGLNAQF